MANASTTRLDDLADKLKGKNSELREKSDLLDQAKGLITKLDDARKKAIDKAARVDDRYKDLTSPERVAVAAIAGLVAGGLTSLGISASVGFLAKHSAAVKRNEGYITGAAQVVVGGGTAGTALALRGDNPGLASDIAFSAGMSTAGYGAAKVGKTWWDRRKAQKELMSALVEQKQVADAQAAAAQAQMAAQAQQQARNG